ncbi:LOG family protein [Candidatus Microgenomates bacterium]|nr:LOG family protein [Candidatus Microgenomates bacterium]
MDNYKSLGVKNIAFFGDANIPASDPVYKSAFNTAKLLAENGYTIVDGGGPGVMVAATNGAKEAGGATLTVTFNPVNATGFEEKYVENVADKEIITTNYIERMFKLMEHGDIFVMFKGGSGTISEFGTAWVLAKIYYGHHKPFILMGRFWAEIIDVFRKNMNIDKAELSVFEIVEKPEDVLKAIHKFEERLAKRTKK